MAATVITNRAHAAVQDFPRRQNISHILVDLFKFAIGSAIDGSRKITPGSNRADKMVQEGMLNIPLPTTLKTKKKPYSNGASEIFLESKMEEDMNNIKQQYKASVKHVAESHPSNKSDGDFKELNLLKKHGKRVFIRSRL